MTFCLIFVSFPSPHPGNESVVSPSYSDAGLRAYLEHPLTSSASTGDATTVKETPSLLYDFNKFAVSTSAAGAGAGVATSSSSAVVAGSSTAPSSGITELVVLAPRSQGVTMATVGR